MKIKLILMVSILLIILTGCSSSGNRGNVKCGESANCNPDRDFIVKEDDWCRDNFPLIQNSVREYYKHNKGFCCGIIEEPNWGNEQHICIPLEYIKAHKKT